MPLLLIALCSCVYGQATASAYSSVSTILHVNTLAKDLLIRPIRSDHLPKFKLKQLYCSFFLFNTFGRACKYNVGHIILLFFLI